MHSALPVLNDHQNHPALTGLLWEQTGAYPQFAYPNYNDKGQLFREQPKWINARYYRTFVMPPWCPDKQQLKAFAGPSPSEQSQHLHIQNMYPLGNFTKWDTASSGQAAQAQHVLAGITDTQTGPDWTGQGHLSDTTHPGVVSQMFVNAALVDSASSLRLGQQQNVASLPPLSQGEQFPHPGFGVPVLPHQEHYPDGRLGPNQSGPAELWNFDDLNTVFHQHHPGSWDPNPNHPYSLGQMGLRAQRRYGISSAGLRQRWAL